MSKKKGKDVVDLKQLLCGYSNKVEKKKPITRKSGSWKKPVQNTSFPKEPMQEADLKSKQEAQFNNTNITDPSLLPANIPAFQASTVDLPFSNNFIPLMTNHAALHQEQNLAFAQLWQQQQHEQKLKKEAKEQIKQQKEETLE